MAVDCGVVVFNVDYRLAPETRLADVLLFGDFTDQVDVSGVLTMLLISMKLSNMLLRTRKILVLTLLVLP